MPITKHKDAEAFERELAAMRERWKEPPASIKCIDCGGPRSFGSALRCKDCFARRVAETKAKRDAAIEERRQRAEAARLAKQLREQARAEARERRERAVAEKLVKKTAELLPSFRARTSKVRRPRNVPTQPQEIVIRVELPKVVEQPAVAVRRRGVFEVVFGETEQPTSTFTSTVAQCGLLRQGTRVA